MDRNRRILLVILGIIILGMVGLSIGLTGMPLQPGNMLPFTGILPTGNYLGLDLPGGLAILETVRIIYIIALLTLPLMMIYLIISPSARRQFLKYLARFLPIILGFYLFSVAIKGCQGRKPEIPNILGDLSTQVGLPVLPTPVVITEPPESFIVMISVFISLGILSMVGTVFWLIWKRRHLGSSPNRQIARQAQSALDDLQIGGDLKNTIIRCYYRMSAVINEQRGILRTQEMTPHEFEYYLTARGMPDEPVHQLTHLFEQVRYGNLEVGALEEQAALKSLTEIIAACGKTN